jgi:hypothetical protein
MKVDKRFKTGNRKPYDKDRDWNKEMADTQFRTNKDELFVMSKLLTEENRRALVVMILNYNNRNK